ncbi:putative Homeodomain-like domain-containing protein 6, partial [Homarus americanus]
GKELGRDTIVAIITPYKEGYKCKDIATRVGIGVQQVQKWIKKFRDGGEKLARCIPQRLEKVIKLRGKSLGK